MSIAYLPASTTLTVSQALAMAMTREDLTEVLIIGSYGDGELYIGSSRMTCSSALWLAEKARLNALGL